MIDGCYAVDYQVHSLRSHDGKVPIREMCLRALLIGLDEIGFSEHKDFDPKDPVVNYFEYDRYIAEIEEARAEFGDKLQILAGVEIDYQFPFEPEIEDYLDSHEFDFVLGSVHCVQGLKVMSPEYNRKRSRRDAYVDYFNEVRRSLEFGMFDVLAHLEYANRLGIAAFGPYRAGEFETYLEQVMDEAIDAGAVLEINTAGLFHGIQQTYPSAETVAIYASRSAGLPVSIGSDAHHPDQLGGNFSAAVKVALDAGICTVATWRKREITCRPLTAP